MNYYGPGLYRHYKGGTYQVLGLALQENTVTKRSPEGHVEQVGEGHDEVTFVIYQPLSPGSMLEQREELFWARELGDFNEAVNVVGERSGTSVSVPRFRKVTGEW